MKITRSARRFSTTRIRIALVALVAAALVALPISVAPAFAATFSVTVTSSPKVGTAITPTLSHPLSSATYTYQWTGGSTDPTFTPTVDNIGHRIIVIVTQHLTNQPDVLREAVTTHSVVAGTFTTHAFTIVGSRHVGQKLFVGASATWTPAADSTTFQWYRNGVAVPSRTDLSYQLGTADLGAKISVRKTVTRAGFTTASRVSSSTIAIGDPYFTTQGSTSLQGRYQIDGTLGVETDAGDFVPAATTFSYQWTINGAAAPSGTGATFVIPGSAANKIVGLRLKASALGIAPVTIVLSESTPPATPTLMKTMEGSISGTPGVGSKLTARGPLFGSTPVSYTYQWFVREPGNEAPITGATHSTYTIPASHDGQVIGVRIFSTRPGYVPQSSSYIIAYPAMA